ncbi:hemolymph proteinase 16 [Danaus plexippus plexippus]|uniref:Hemolymph proteinase 16 n=1 Tax=Danaus plexippus plexippus TaxID=278856 RepID=A0A212FN87_DANPL|nr:hemolymph proteinase 16 [Danaus plexippus plexippus]
MKVLNINSIVIIIYCVLNVETIKFARRVRKRASYDAFPCSDSEKIKSYFSAGLVDGYNIKIDEEVVPGTLIKLKFDSEAAVTLDKAFANFYNNKDIINNIYDIILFRFNNTFVLNVKGQPAPYPPPYLTSIKINGNELCSQPNLTYFEDYPVGVVRRPNVPDRFCGRRKVIHSELITNGLKTKPGEWPFHAALHRREKMGLRYTCGGTLISKFFVLTAAHCTTVRGVAILPEIFSVFLGKYNLFGGDVSVQEKEVYKVYVHDEFTYRTLDNDISLLKLKTEAVYDNYVQPACLWFNNVYDQLPSSQIQGTVPGWGFDITDSLSPTLHAASMPLVPDRTCELTNPLFYVQALRTAKKFCAGYTNGTSACNGDSGGGFHVFVPDLAKSNIPDVPGAWYIRGIVSTSLSRTDAAICNPKAYAVFTDVEKYLDWINIYVNS